MPVRPHIVSKINTVAQIVLAATVLASLGLRFDADLILPVLMALVTILTLLSIGFYVAEWIRHFGTNGTVR
jgi:cardiolipin synthase